MPQRGFVSALNVNKGFAEFLAEGHFEARPSIPTYSSAMDVGDPSNLERIRWLYPDDLGQLRHDVTGVSVSDEDTRTCIADVYERTGYVLDPHTAVGYLAHSAVPAPDDTPSVVLATAHPAKFPDVVEEAIGRAVPLPPGIAAVMDAEEHMEDIPAELAALSTKMAER
jgi:threonine synthase